MNWIPANIPPPDNGDNTNALDYVLVFIPRYGVMQGFYMNGEWHHNFVCKFSHPVTHWTHIEYPEDAK